MTSLSDDKFRSLLVDVTHCDMSQLGEVVLLARNRRDYLLQLENNKAKAIKEPGFLDSVNKMFSK